MKTLLIIVAAVAIVAAVWFQRTGPVPGVSPAKSQTALASRGALPAERSSLPNAQSQPSANKVPPRSNAFLPSQLLAELQLSAEDVERLTAELANLRSEYFIAVAPYTKVDVVSATDRILTIDAPKSVSEAIEARVAATVSRYLGEADEKIVQVVLNRALQNEFDYFGRELVVYKVGFDSSTPSASRLVRVEREMVGIEALSSGSKGTVTTAGLLPMAQYQKRFGPVAQLSFGP